MSSRRHTDYGRHLMLVHGGKRTAGNAALDDWDDFCHRIGFVEPAPEPDEGFEERLLRAIPSTRTDEEGLSDQDTELARSGIRRLWAECEVCEPAPAIPMVIRASATPPEANDEGRSGLWARVAVTVALAATVLLAVTHWAVSRPDSQSAAVPLPPAETAQTVTEPPRTVSPEQSPLFLAPTAELSSTPVAKPKAPLPRPKAPSEIAPEPPGTVLAQNVVEEPVYNTSNVIDRPASWSASLEDRASSEPPPVAAAPGAWAPAPVTVDSAAPWSTPAPAVAVSPVEAPSKVASSVWSGRSRPDSATPADSAQPASASWTLSGARDRWVGASLTPVPAAAQANIGVMVQLDLGRAFGKL